jgi:glycolate oxidase subunit GlcD
MLHEERVPFVPRGAGTGLSGGAVPMAGSVVLNMARLRRIHLIDPHRRVAVVEPGVVNVTLSKEAARYGLEFAPDPSSESTSTIGGNVAENAGGPHTLKKGVTRPHVLGLEVVRPDGRMIILPWGVEGLEEILPVPPEDLPGPDLLSLMTGGEGTLGVVTRIVCRLTPLPEACETLVGFFTDGDDAVSSVTDLLASGFIPAAVEMIDEVALHTVAEAFSLSVPDEAKVFLLVEVDGLAEEVKFQARRVEEIFRDRRALETRRAEGEEERGILWAARKKAVGALGRIAPSYYVHDGVVPRSRMGEVLEEVRRLSDEHGLRTANIFHAGDGNLHPIILFDEADPDESQRALSLGEEILKLCVRVGGTLTGEHGIGWEKRHLMSHLFSEMQIDVMSRIRDLFNPDGLLNPEKIIPLPVGCLEGGRGPRPATGERSWRDIVLESRDGGRQDQPRSMILSSYEEEEPAPEEVQKLCASLLGPKTVARIIEGIPALDLADPIVEVQPENGESVERILNLAHREGWHVLPRGGGTQLTQAGPVSRVDVVLDLSSLSRVHDISSGDLIVEADAGIRLHELNEALEPHGLWVPLDAPDPHHSTLGGVLATSYTGPWTGSWGSGRFRVLALESCSPGLGRQLWGRGVTKNVAGYDVARLMVGSMGTLSVFTRAILRADPRPRRWRTAVLSGPTSALVPLARALFESFRPWSHLELLASAGDPPDDPWWPKGANVALLVGCDGTDEVSRRLEKDVPALLDEIGCRENVVLDWCSTEELSPSVALWCSGFSGEMALRCHTDPLAAPDALVNLLEQNPSRIQLHLKTGVLRTVWQESLPSREDLGKILGVRSRVVLERASRVTWRSFLGKEAPKTAEVESLADLKRILDPSGLLRPVTTLPVRILEDETSHDADEGPRVPEVSP